MFRTYVIVFSLLAIQGASCRERTEPPIQQNEYILYYTPSALHKVLWDSCRKLSSLHAPWEDGKKDKTVFQAYYDSMYLFFRFTAIDSSITTPPPTSEDAVATGDRVELFFSADSTIKNYYCIEIGPGGHVLDYRASFYRKFDTQWNLTGLNVQTSVQDKSYIVSGQIPINFFLEIIGSKAITGSEVYLGIFRADTTPEKAEKKFTWFSWITPNSEQPDFHIPSAFGRLLF